MMMISTDDFDDDDARARWSCRRSLGASLSPLLRERDVGAADFDDDGSDDSDDDDDARAMEGRKPQKSLHTQRSKNLFLKTRKNLIREKEKKTAKK